MSQENLELAKQGVAAINEAYTKGDIAPWRQQVEKVVDAELYEGGRDVFTEGDWHGQAGAIAFVANQMEVLKEMWMRLDEYIDVDEDCFIMGVTFGGQARHTAIPVELHPFHVFTLRNRKILQWRIFRTREEALEAAGLSESATSRGLTAGRTLVLCGLLAPSRVVSDRGETEEA
jgi:hypothetical protein